MKVIRVISIQEKIDSKGELFPSTSIADVLFMFGSLSEEVVALRKATAHVEYIKSGIKPAKSSTPKKGIDRERNIVNMYNNNYTIDDIWKVSGNLSMLLILPFCFAFRNNIDEHQCIV